MDKARKPINGGAAALTINSVHQEDMSDMIKLLVQKASIVTCWPDAKGLTPLHQVAAPSKPHNVELTKFILDNCRQSAEVCDNSGKSILHHLINKIPDYEETKNLLSHKEMYALRNYQDHQGNTPLHVAAKSKDINMVRFLLESSVKLNIDNADVISAASLVEEQEMLKLLRKRKLTKEEIDATNRVNINFLRERMSILGVDFLLSQDSSGKNILHKTMLIKKGSRMVLDDFLKFIEEALKRFPSLISQKDSKRDTPIHVLVRNHPDTTIYFRFDLVKFYPKFWHDERKSSKGKDDQLWLVRLLELPNRSGKTPNDLLAESPSVPSDICTLNLTPYNYFLVSESSNHINFS